MKFFKRKSVTIILLLVIPIFICNAVDNNRSPTILYTPKYEDYPWGSTVNYIKDRRPNLISIDEIQNAIPAEFYDAFKNDFAYLYDKASQLNYFFEVKYDPKGLYPTLLVYIFVFSPDYYISPLDYQYTGLCMGRDILYLYDKGCVKSFDMMFVSEDFRGKLK